MKVEEILSGIFDPGTEESETIIEAYNLISTAAPTVSAEAKTHLILLDHSRVKLATIYYSLCRRISQLNHTIQSTYDSQYTRLVKLGRPSKDAIECEIRATNPEYSGVSKKISDLEEVKTLISMYIRCIDASKSTTTEILKNIYRLD